ncbi:phage tail tube protein [Lichenihabitans sp. PAMC28606]|uniref:phage tail tube protein n=1 Tax=Lichenihabitans sp. PAMC28606 TaxID=2880932 RepID=UPI001D0A07F3|nr:phage tail tube protein [Lichenihabitans sp. PAMC28606]UDL95506.1 phage tail tube protein [Lichenihabitans sp. PAMC28606]
MDTKGGRFSLTMSGTTYSGRGAAKLMLSGVSPTTGVNQDGTPYRTVAPKLVGLDLSFDRGVGLLWDETMLLNSIDVTFVETDLNKTHLFTSASWDGDPTIDSATGEVTGLKVMTGSLNYQTY